MSPATNRERLVEAVARFNQGDLGGYFEIYSDDCVFHGYPPDFSPDRDGVRGFYETMGQAFPGAQLILEDVITTNDHLVVRFSMSGAQEGELMGIPPTGITIEQGGMTILRFDGGKCVERWQSFDMLGILRQLGAFPPPPPAGA